MNEDSGSWNESVLGLKAIANSPVGPCLFLGMMNWHWVGSNVSEPLVYCGLCIMMMRSASYTADPVRDRSSSVGSFEVLCLLGQLSRPEVTSMGISSSRAMLLSSRVM